MRKLFCFLATAVALLGAGGTRADIGPPVTVRILGEPRAAEPGVPFVGQLQITTGGLLVLDDLKFGGEGWDQLSLVVAPQVSVDKSRPLIVDFSVVTDDPAQWLELTCTVDGLPVVRHFDLSAATIAGLQTVGTTSSVTPTDDVMPLTDETRVSPLPAVSEPTAKREPDAGEKSRSIRVHGRFTYQRTDGWTIGADGVTVRVFDDNSPLGSTELAAVATNAQGWYDVTFTWTGGLFDSEPDLHLGFETSNTSVTVAAVGSVNPYIWKTATSWDYTGSDKDYGWLQPSDINQHPAVHLLTTLVRTWRWWMAYGYNPPGVRCNWPGLTGNSFFAGQIYITDSQKWYEDVVSHEYGHHWVVSYASSPIPGYCNDKCDGAAPFNCGHCLWCYENSGIAFTEGFPDWMGDVIPNSFGASYGRDAYSVYDFESLQTCGGVPDDPLITEGFLAAVVRDIGDNTNDDHPRFPETDELSVGYAAAIACVDLDAPVTAIDFLNAFKNRYPAYREGLWATAMNCGYELDIATPPAVTGLYSTSHTTGATSADPTIDFAWTRPVDDCAGVRGYGVMIAGGPGVPEPIMDIGDVTSYTTPSLAPGTYYFSIRALDRSGKWSDAYAYGWSGPYTVRAPLSANLAVYQFGGWDKVLVPRSTSDASFGSVPAPVTLQGNAAETWWNVGLWNAGESTTGAGFDIRAYVDGDWHWWVWSGELGPYWGQYGCNIGPLNVRGGRHTFETRLDGSEVIAETNEGDNRWAHQWVWNPLPLTANVPVVRNAPPLKMAGWEAVVDGSALYYNADGLRMGASSYWDAVVLRPLDATSDQDLNLHAASTGAADGFAGIVAGSARGIGGIDAVIVNRNVMGWSSYDVGVTNYNGNGSSYEVVQATNSALAFGDSVTVPLAQNEMLRLWEFYVGAGNVGAVSITVDVDPAGGPLVAEWLDRNFTTGNLGSFAGPGFSGIAVTDASGRARLDVAIPDTGYHALLVYRDPDFSKGTGPLNVTIELQKTPPDFVPLHAAGWYAPIVPRASFDGTAGSVPGPTTLPGNVGSTYLNMAVRNESPSDSPAGLPGYIYIDGSYSAWVTWGWFPAYAEGLFNWGLPWTFSGGRHTLAWKLDANQTIEEIHEDNNSYSEQWVWSPLDLVNETPVVRDMPADPYGGWTELSTGEAFYPNCDGLRMPNTGGYWRAVATMPEAGSDVDLRLHAAGTGAKNGFAGNLAGSYWGGSSSDYVLVNFNLAPGGFQPYDAGVVRYAGYGNYTAESTAPSGGINFPNGLYGPYTLPVNRILNLLEVYLPAGRTGIELQNVKGDVDWGVSLHRSDLAYQGKSDALGISYSAGLGGNEVLLLDVPVSAYYSIAVWKTTASELPKGGVYNLFIWPLSASGVDDRIPAPQLTGLVDITPNPFNPQTKITYDLARDGHVQLDVYDVHGRRVRTLVNGDRGAGRHSETWNGADENGGRVASGAYLARLTVGGVTGMMKMMLLK